MTKSERSHSTNGMALDTTTNTLIETAGVACVPGNSFFANPEHGRYFLRFCYAKEMTVLEAACYKLREAFR